MSYWLYANLSPIWILEHDSSRNKAASTASCGSQVLWRSQQCSSSRTNIIFTEYFVLPHWQWSVMTMKGSKIKLIPSLEMLVYFFFKKMLVYWPWRHEIRSQLLLCSRKGQQNLKIFCTYVEIQRSLRITLQYFQCNHFPLKFIFQDNSFEQVSAKKFHRGLSASPRVLKNFQVSFISILWPRKRLILGRCPMPSLISQILEIVGCIARMHTAQKNSFFFPPSNCSRRRGGQQYYKFIRSTEMSLQFTLCTVCISSLRAYTNQILIREAFFVYDDITDFWFLHRSNIC